MERREISKEVYNRVIDLIPKEIINMLPEEPEKLLPYATRVCKMQVSAGINDEVKQLMEEHLLSDEEYLKTFYYVMAITFVNKHPVENPEIAIVAAQTGSGKSNLTAKILRKNGNYIFVDSDKYKHFRYDAQDIAKEYPVIYPQLTGPDGYDHATDIYNYATDKKYNIIKETAPSATKGLVELDINALKEKNYSISVHILAVGELNSLLSVHERYELQIIHGLKTAKLTGIPRHDESYNALIKNVMDLENNTNISSINIYMRGIKEENFNPKKIYPSNIYSSPEDAIIAARKIDNDKTIKEFNERYNLVLLQMDKRNAPKPQYEQLEQIRERWKILSKGI
ncbi:MAG: zeta toxin family protein [Clostridia bacterium]